MSEPRWHRFTAEEYYDVMLRRQTARCLPGDWDFRPEQMEQIRAQYPGMTDDEFYSYYWVCDNFCMLCAAPLKDGHCSAPIPWFSLVPRDERHLTRVEILVLRFRWWLFKLLHGRDPHIDDIY